MAALIAVWLTRRQDRKQFELELKEREKDRIMIMKERVADRIIDVHLKLYQLLSELQLSIGSRLWELKPPTEIIDGEEVQVNYTDFHYVRSPKKPDSRHVRDVFVEVDAYLSENGMWFQPSFAGQVDEVLDDLEIIINDDAIDVFATTKDKAKTLAQPYADILDKIPSLMSKVKTSMGIEFPENTNRR